MKVTYVFDVAYERPNDLDGMLRAVRLFAPKSVLVRGDRYQRWPEFRVEFDAISMAFENWLVDEAGYEPGSFDVDFVHESRGNFVARKGQE